MNILQCQTVSASAFICDFFSVKNLANSSLMQACIKSLIRFGSAQSKSLMYLNWSWSMCGWTVVSLFTGVCLSAQKLRKKLLITNWRSLQCYSEPQKWLDFDLVTFDLASCLSILQDARLSQRDRAAGCVIVFAKSRTLERGDNDLRTL